MNQTIERLFSKAGGRVERDELGNVLTYSENCDPSEFAQLVMQECIGKYDEWAEHSTDKTRFALARHNVKKLFQLK